MPLRRYLVTWTRSFMDGRSHTLRDVILATSPTRASDVMTRLYGAWPGFRLRRVEPIRHDGRRTKGKRQKVKKRSNSPTTP